MANRTGRSNRKSSPPPSFHTASELEFGGAFIATIASSPKTADAYRYGLGRLAQFIADTKYTLGQDKRPTAPRFPVSGLRDDLLLKFYEWMVDRKYAPPTRDNYIAAVKRFLIWLSSKKKRELNFKTPNFLKKLLPINHTLLNKARCYATRGWSF